MPPDEVESPVSAVMNEKWSLIFSEVTLPKIKRTKKTCIAYRVTAPGFGEIAMSIFYIIYI